MDGNNARETVHYQVHAHLEDVLRYLQAKSPNVPAMVDVKDSHIGGFLIEVYAPEAILSVQLTEVSSAT